MEIRKDKIHKNLLYIELLFVVLALACHQKATSVSLQEAENKVFSLSLTQKVNQYISDFSKGEKGVAFLSDSLLLENKWFYQVQIGYDSPNRYETYYIFYVNKENVEDIRIMEPLSGEIIPLSQWKEDASIYDNPLNNINCEDIMNKIMRSSNIVLLVDRSDCYVQIERVEQNDIFARVYLPADGDSKIITLAWIKYNVTKQKLYDITKELDHPIELSFDKNILTEYNFQSICGIAPQNEKQENNIYKNCIDIDIDAYTSSRECEYDKILDFNILYDSLKTKVKDENLLDKLPKRDTLYKTEEALQINYRLYKDSITIGLFYEGGLTYYKMYHKKDKGVTLETYSAD